MAKLIDADEAKRAIKENDWSNPCVPTVVGMILDRITTIEAEPVRHGRWDFTSCSLCGHSFLEYAEADCDHSFYRYLPNFCPHCGAKMDGKEE